MDAFEVILRCLAEGDIDGADEALRQKFGSYRELRSLNAERRIVADISAARKKEAAR